MEDSEESLSPYMRRLLLELWEEWRQLEEQIAARTREIRQIAARSEDCRRLMQIPGVGALVATALLAAVGNARDFARGRDLDAWLGLVPRQRSTGGKPKAAGH